MRRLITSSGTVGRGTRVSESREIEPVPGHCSGSSSSGSAHESGTGGAAEPTVISIFDYLSRVGQSFRSAVLTPLCYYHESYIRRSSFRLPYHQ